MNQPYSYKNNKKSINCKDEININNCNKKPSIKPYPCTCFGVIGATGPTGPTGPAGTSGMPISMPLCHQIMQQL